MKISRISLFCIISLANLIIAQSLENSFERFTHAQGLSQLTGNTILQDSHGFLWVGTNDGLNRFDGYNFRIFRKAHGDSSSISDNSIRCLFEDSQSNLWIGTRNGLNRFDRYRESFVSWKHDPADTNSLSGDDIRAICEDQAGFIWVGTHKNGLNRFDLRTGKFQHFKADTTISGLTHNTVSALYPGIDDKIWVGTMGGGLNCYNSNSNSWDYFRKANTSGLQSDYILTFHVSFTDSAILWIGTYGGGLMGLNLETEIFTPFLNSESSKAAGADNRIFAITSDNQGKLWLGTFAAGLLHFDPFDGSFVSLKNQLFSPTSLSANFIRSVFVDRSNILWAGTNINGINKLDLKQRKFHGITYNPQDTTGLDNQIVNAVAATPNGDVWIATDAGLNRVLYSSGEIEHLHFNFPGHRRRTIIKSLTTDRDGSLWIGTYGSGIFHYNSRTGSQHIFGTKQGLTDDRVRSLYVDRQGNLWIGTVAGVQIKEFNTGKLQNPLSDYFDQTIPVTCLQEDSSGQIWIGSLDGLYLFSRKKKSFQKFYHDKQDVKSISHNHITTLTCDNLGTVWIGTQYGLNRFEPTNGNFVHYDETTGLPNAYICGLLPDDSGSLWISTNNGLCRLSRDNSVRNFDLSDGLVGIEFMDNACARVDAGIFYFGGIGGVTWFDRNGVQDNNVAPEVSLTHFRIFEQPVVLDSVISARTQLELNYDQNFFSFEFASLDFTSPEKNRYRYKMQGFNHDWINADKRNYASYTNLDPGKYTFLVEGSNNDGVWSEHPARLELIITPPFWKTAWFQFIILLAGIALITVFYQLRIHKLLEIERLRIQIASDLHDDIGASLTRISLYSDLINTGTMKEKSSEFLQKISDLSRELVTTMSDVVWSIDARNDTIGNLAYRMLDFVNTVREANNQKILFDFAGIDKKRRLSGPERQNFYLIFKEALNNSLKHANASVISVKLQQNPAFMLLEIYDNGQGFEPDEKINGHGLRNMRMRTQQLGAELEITSDDGTNVVLRKNYKKGKL